MKLFHGLFACLAAVILQAPAAAAWLEARSDHFIIDANTSEVRLHDFANRLERFDAALRHLYGIGDDPAQRSNRLTIFAVDDNTVHRLCGGCASSVAGFYHGSGGRSVIVTSALGGGGMNELTPLAVLLHEYSHHFMFTNSPGTYPMWYTEGFAEFNATAEMRQDGVVIGAPPRYRVYGLLHETSEPELGSRIVPPNKRLPIRELLEPPPTVLKDAAVADRFYGRSWLLMHHLELSPDRRGQLAIYIDHLRQGEPSLTAAQAAFGNLDKLGGEINAYVAGKRLNAALLVPPAPQQPTIEVVPLSAGAAAMMPAHMRSVLGVTIAEAKADLPAIAARAAAFPRDARVQVELAEAAYDAGDDAAAEAAADKAIAVEPQDAMALLYKGRAALRLAIAQGHDAAKIAAARSWIVKANHAQPDAARPLVAYYRSFGDAGQTPTAAAIKGLMRATAVAPEDDGIRWLMARQALLQDDDAMARSLLGPIAFAPHDAGNADQARQALARLVAGDKAGALAILSPKAAEPDA